MKRSKKKPPKPGPKKLPTKRTLGDLINKMGNMTHGSTVLIVTSILDYDLERCIGCRFRDVDKETEKRLFRGTNAPLGSFSAKIDIAHALDITSDRVHRELHRIRDVRNAFAHTKAFLHFEEEPALTLFKRLDIHPDDIDPLETRTPLNYFMGHALAMDRYLENFLLVNGVADEIYGLKPSTFDY
jgi:hypothetical protein